MTQTTNFAVIGRGRIVRRGRLPGLLVNGKARVPMIHGPETANSHELADSFGIPRPVHSIEEALTTPDLDGLVIALPRIRDSVPHLGRKNSTR